MLRAWQDVVRKWQMTVPGDGAGDLTEAQQCSRSARLDLVEGRLDAALVAFERAASLRGHPHDLVGIGDVHLARGRWQLAAEHYQRALQIDRVDPLAQLGNSQVLVAQGKATSAIPQLEQMVAASPGDLVLRYYLASTWCSVAEQCRGQTLDEVLVFTSEHQLRVCEVAASRILDLDVDDEELVRGADRLLAEVAAGRRWSWAPEGVTVSLAVLSVSLGLMTVVAGGTMHNVGLVIAGIALGGALLSLVVLRFRRQAWRRRAESVAPVIAKPGV
jgi:Tetratricopeptide repeat